MEGFYKENQVILSMTEYNGLKYLKENYDELLDREKSIINQGKKNLEEQIRKLKNCEWYIEYKENWYNHYDYHILVNTEILKDNKYVKKLAKELFQQEKEMFEQEKKSYRLHQWLKSFCFWLWLWLAIYLLSLI